jgi:hypothetical protein
VLGTVGTQQGVPSSGPHAEQLTAALLADQLLSVQLFALLISSLKQAQLQLAHGGSRLDCAGSVYRRYRQQAASRQHYI